MVIRSYLKSFSDITNIPVCVYHDGKYDYLLSKTDTDNSARNKIYSYVVNQKDDLLWIDGLLLFYKLEYQHEIIIIGPCLSYIPTDFKTVSNLLTKRMFLLKEELDTVQNQLFKQRVVNYIYFKNCINILTLALLDKEYEETFSVPANSEQENPEESVVEKTEIEWSNYNLKYMEMMKYIIKNGLLEELKELFKNEQSAPYGTLGPTELRHYKNSMMIHIYIVRSAAHEGGVDEDLCIRLSELYAQQCEAAKSIRELTEISQKLRLDFCTRAKKAQKLSCSNLTITKAMQYIHEHRMEKLDSKEISLVLGISSSYLCHEFKKEIGISIVDFIHNEKIKLAKKMLIFTDYSLIEISNYLSFSSQSYFQAVFKKCEGITPNEFRRREVKNML